MNSFKLLTVLFVFFFSGLYAQKNYQVSIDLTKTSSDQLSVEIITPKVSSDQIDFHVPKIVPGTYAISNFGSFVSNFKASDQAGNSLTITHPDANTWKIDNAKKLYKITYTVDDTWDTPQIKEDVFEPGGTSFEKDTAFVLNTFGVIGYLQGNEKKPYQVQIKRAEGFYGATSLELKKSPNPNVDLFETDSYQTLADAPILYSRPDTAWIKVANASVLVSVFSVNGKSSAKALVKDVQPILEGHAKYLGGKLPVKKYAFLVYLSNKKNLTRFGALEHTQSCLTFMPDSFSPEELSSQFRDIASHEFLHIITPLTIHSEEIGNFDFIDAKMSKHLWMYEGVTEYAAHHSQLRSGAISLEEYLKRQTEKIGVSKKYFNDTLAFTVLSSEALDKQKEQYQNVYQKGALIGLCLDVKLLTLSNGKYGLPEVMARLGKKYGMKKSFKDAVLFDQIASMTFPEIRTFFKDYVESGKPLPLKETFDALGISYNPEATRKGLETSMAFGAGLAPDRKHLVITDMSGATNLGKRLGFQPGDVFVSMNGESFTLETYQECFAKYSSTVKLGDTVKFVVQRKDANGEEKEVALEADVREETQNYIGIEPLTNPSVAQQKIRNAWLGK
ncbi:MAG: peptidase M61 [Cyclobacteriaceae bacterium]|nr:peptidase M61 [Cyclobacteriaceae bacterium]